MSRTQPESVLLEKVYNTVEDKLEPSQAPLAIELLKGLFTGLSGSDLARRNDSDLYGVGLSIWNGLHSTPADTTNIRVYNPELEKHGWQSSHTIVEIIVPDQPFLVDSIRMALNRLSINAHLLLHNPVAVARKGNDITGIFPASNDKHPHQATLIIEIDRQSDQVAMDRIKAEFNGVLDEITLIVSDWRPMLDKLGLVRDELAQNELKLDEQPLKEAVSYLDWLSKHNFTLMGYRYYTLEAVAGDYVLQPQEEHCLGLFKIGLGKNPMHMSKISSKARAIALGSDPLLLNKSNYTSRVHRPANIDHVGVKVFDNDGSVIGEHRFIGLYASGIYNHSAIHIPMINAKVMRIMEQSRLTPKSHAYKALLNIIDTYPRDELIQASEKDLLTAGLGISKIQERDMLRLFIRADTYGRYYSCIVYTNKERYNTELRINTQAILKNYFDSCGEVEFNTYFTEGVMARTQYIVRVNNIKQDLNAVELEQNLIEAARSWDDKLVDSLNGNYGEEQAKQLARKYQHAFPRSYKESLMPGSAVADVKQLEQLSDKKRLGMLFYRPQEELEGSTVVKLKLFHLDRPLHLSDILPMLENMGLQVIDESPYKIESSDGRCYWILDFSMTYGSGIQLDIESHRDNFQQALDNIWQGKLEDDGFNRLVLGAESTGRDVALLRAYAKYLRQIGSNFSQQYIADTLTRYPDIANQLISLFHRRFNPKMKRSTKSEANIAQQIHLGLDEVSNLDDDRIIRRYLELIQATLRTNYYQQQGQKDHIAFKFCAEKIAEMPAPKPKFEIFVYSPRVEGVHLRGGKVARGGLRWSDRREDFRTEVLGLVKAQQVKNAVIVPVGAKGGFVCKQMPTMADRAMLLAEGKSCYKIFIRGLLDITDNIIAGKVVPPADVVRHDEDDPYLVVAADKGTATFSDIANGLSDEYQFWMGDAFASGGSHGYDHKAMGITARGAWESVKRHFRELGTDCQAQMFTCVGIGDMSGDVFGNGLLLSQQTQLVAAFNHLHIFIDPTPDCARTFKERERLFELQGSSWSDYDTQLISKGGGIFSRSAKSIPLNDEIRKLLDINAKSLTPSELIRAILRSPVSLIWNGGIGTYVKSSSETDADVGDRANNPVRVNGKELRAKIFGEGGNLGCTQLGRIEFAGSGGRINTDFIDNVGGVDCSDNEVNIKILLNQQVSNGDLTEKQRNALLVEMTDNVSEIVLNNAYRQSQSVSVTHALGHRTVKENMRFIHGLEREGSLDRALEFLPSDDEILERLAHGSSFTRPELAVLLAYAKMTLKETLKVPEVTEDPFLSHELVKAFPLQLQSQFASQMLDHPLRHEIIATRLANRIVDDMGFNFVSRLSDETGASSAEICTCYIISREVFQLEKLFDAIEKLDNQVDASIQLDMMAKIRRLGRRATRRFLRLRNRNLGITEQINRYQGIYQELKGSLDVVLEPEDVNQIEQAMAYWMASGVPEPIALEVAQLSSLYACMDIAEIGEQVAVTSHQVSDLYFSLGAHVELHWFLLQIDAQPVDNHWQALARASFREDLDWQQRCLVQTALTWIMARELDIKPGLDAWLEAHGALLGRWQNMLADFKTTSTHEFAKFSVLLRELNLLNLNCSNLA